MAPSAPLRSARARAPGGPRAAAPRRDGGFTLIELMIVIAIIAIVAAIAIPNLLAAKLSSNETAALATLRTIVTAEAQLGVTGKIDCDNDGRGEHGTLMEMTGAIGVRRNYTAGTPGTCDFSALGVPISPPILTSVMSRVDANGFATKAGYAYIVFLPDASTPATFVHETNAGTPGTFVPGLSGGSNTIAVDMAETYWSVYARPMNLRTSGNRQFFASSSGDILQSSNEVSMAAGVNTVPTGDAAYMGAGITSPLALGTRGNDGDLWRSAN